MNVKKYVRALLCLYLTLIIATDAVKGQSLKVGDTLPPELWSMQLQVVNHQQGKETLTLSDYKDKLIILDFWATWCAPCIKSLSKLDSLQREFGEQLAVIPITYENADKVLPFLTKRGYQLPSIINDSTLKKYFPHRSIPHQVWVRAGEVLALTGAEYATRENISKTLNEEKVHMLTKEEDMEFDVSKFLLPLQDGFTESSLKSKVNIRNSAYSISPYGVVSYNRSLIDLVKEAYSIDLRFIQFDNRIVTELPDSLHLRVFVPDKSVHASDNLYTYINRSRFPRSRKDIYTLMQQDINHYLLTNMGIKVSCEKRAIKCLVIKQTTPVEPAFASLSTYSYRSENKPFYYFVHALTRANQTKSTPIINETNILENKSINLRSNLDDLTNVNKELLQYGLTLVEEVRDIEIMLLTTIPKKAR